MHCAIMDDESDDGETFLEQMFKTPVVEHEVFYFRGIDISYDGCQTTVIFHYNYANSCDIYSRLYVDGDICSTHRDILISIGLCILPWYWMGFGTHKIVIEASVCWTMHPCDTKFWKLLYDNVLSEYMHVNKITFQIELECALKSESDPIVESSIVSTPNQALNSVLIPLGGGKDSLVAWHLSLEMGQCPRLLYVCDRKNEFEENDRIQRIVTMTNSPLHIVRHDFDSAAFEGQAMSYLRPCGHPWAALVLFDSVLVCAMNGFDSVSLGFEKSADEGNGVFLRSGTEVNHQYDKSSMFLTAAQHYINMRFCSSACVKVYSLLQDMWELEITRIFCTSSRLQEFHSHFMSCNSPVGGAQCNWCCKCEKCSFMFLMLSAWLPPARVVEIFGTDLLSGTSAKDDKLCATFRALLGCAGFHKPFECVGTPEEVRAAVQVTVNWHCTCCAKDPHPTWEQHFAGTASEIANVPHTIECSECWPEMLHMLYHASTSTSREK